MITSDWHQEQKPTQGDGHFNLPLAYETLGITVTKLKVIYVTMMENKLTENKYYHDLFSLWQTRSCISFIFQP